MENEHEDLIPLHEDEKTEFKREFTPKIYKEVVAFINTDGGTIYIGIDDQGNRIGLSDPAGDELRLTNGIRDSIKPDPMVYVHTSNLAPNLIRVDVQEGARKPYYIGNLGISPKGVYVRQGTSSAPASFSMIRKMIKESDHDIYEEMRSFDQNLSFEQLSQSFRGNSLEFGENKFMTLGLVSPYDHLFTNLALILSDQNPFVTKVALFQNKEKTVFQKAVEFDGPLLSQFDKVMEYLDTYNGTRFEIEEIYRKNVRDYPVKAVREAVLNAFIHRDYNFNGPIIINITNQEMEVISLGGLVDGIGLEEIQNGVSLLRNPKLGSIFSRINLIEGYGTGIRRILEEYEDNERKPEFHVTDHSFRIVLPKIGSQESNQNKPLHLTSQESLIVNLLKEEGPQSRESLENRLNVTTGRIYQLMSALTKKDLIVSSGKGAQKIYSLKGIPSTDKE